MVSLKLVLFYPCLNNLVPVTARTCPVRVFLSESWTLNPETRTLNPVPLFAGAKPETSKFKLSTSGPEAQVPSFAVQIDKLESPMHCEC